MTEKEMANLFPSLEKDLLHDLFTVGEVKYLAQVK